ncbi:hypothetical protein M0804_014918 [Polistes exclamans]|nr:hypothetical protein M0804_014921 [Polistes exclamans]KAI4474312.1 hypothetical protein M0804_014918 [Polistes exclamans]
MPLIDRARENTFVVAPAAAAAAAVADGVAADGVAGSGSLPASPADSGVSDVESSTSSGGNEDANLLLKARLNPNSSLQPSLASHHSHLSSALGRSACHSPGVYPSTAGFLPPSYHPHQHHPSQYHPHRGSSPHNQHGNHSMGAAMGPPHHHHHHQTQSLQHLHYRQPPTSCADSESRLGLGLGRLAAALGNNGTQLPRAIERKKERMKE